MGGKWSEEARQNFRKLRLCQSIHYASLEEALWANVTKAEGCWNWNGSVGNHGYGQVQYMNQPYTSHRLSWELHCGPIPDDLQVLHRCDNRRCCNPGHLFLGTQADNVKDMIEKGRNDRGEAVSTSKLTEAQVKEIRFSSKPQDLLAAEFGISQAHVSNVQTGKRWKHIESGDE